MKPNNKQVVPSDQQRQTPKKELLKKPTLEELREAMAELDVDIMKRFVQRQDLARQVYMVKSHSGTAIWDETQEVIKLMKLKEQVPEDDYMAAAAIQLSLMRVSREAQYELKMKEKPLWEMGEQIEMAAKKMPDYKVVSVQGNASSYGAQAAKELFPTVSILPVRTFSAACQQVVEEIVDIAVLPLENSTAGTVDDVYALLEKYKLYIIATTSIEIQHCLVGVPGTSISSIRKVISHPQALAQCSTIIKGMGWSTEEQLNTAFAAERVALSGDLSQAAIATEAAARSLGLAVISKDITNQVKNQTRFIAVARKPIITENANKLSLIVRLSHQVGSLSRLLALFSDFAFSLSKIQSFPVPQKPWEYSFYIDVLAAPGEAALRLLYQLQQEIPLLRFLGWYEDSLRENM